VAVAKRTGGGIAVEDLTGIGQRVRLREAPTGDALQLGVRPAGIVPQLESRPRGVLLQANAAYTSQQCWTCGHSDRKTRPNQAELCCPACGFSLEADPQRLHQHQQARNHQTSAAVNHAERGLTPPKSELQARPSGAE